MSVSRAESLDRPRGAGRVPALAFVAVLGLVTTVLVIGLARIDWVLVLLVPVLLMTAYFLAGVARVLWATRPNAPNGSQKERRSEEE